jgi:PAS domain S-box-containing protein
MQSMPLLTTQRAVGLLLCALGAVVLTGWAIGSGIMVRIVPGTPAMAVNTALMLIACGVGLIGWKHDRATSRPTAVAGLALIALSTAILLEYVFDADFGIDLPAFHARIVEGSARPGRTSPNASICFLMAGIVFALHGRMRKPSRLTSVLNAMIAVLTATGLTALLGYLLNLEAMYQIATYNRMAAPTAFGLSMLGIGLWSATHHARPRTVEDYRHEDKRITRLAAALLTVFAIAGGVAGFSVLRRGFEQAAQENLRQAVARDAFIVSESINHARLHARSLATSAPLAARLAALSNTAQDTVQDTASMAAVVNFGNQLLPLGFDRIGFYSDRGDLLASSGRLRANPAPITLSLPLPGTDATLYWQNGFRLRTHTMLLHDGRAAGSVVTESRLSALDALMNEINRTGESHTMLLCGLEGGRGVCFPSRFNRDPLRVALAPRDGRINEPIALALQGKHGAGAFKDGRGVDAIAGYAPLAANGLVAVVKTDMRELYAPIRDRLNLLIALLALFVVIGTCLLRRWVQPLVARILAEQQRMQVILKHSNDAFVALDHAGRVTDWNERAEKTFGWTSEEASGKELTALLVPEEQRDAVRALLNGGARPTTDNRVELLMRHRSGRAIPVEMSIGSFHDGQHQVVSAFLRDISERKHAEKQAAEHAQSLDRARTALFQSQKLEAVGKLTGGVAHDFNNVLQVISGSLQLLQLDLDGNERARKRIVAASGAVERGAKLSSELLAFARRQPLQPVPTDLARVLHGIDDMLQRALGEAIEVVIAAPGDLWNALVDPHQLAHVIINLAINARDAMQGSGRLTIELANLHVDSSQVDDEPGVAAGDYVSISLTDTGCGISPETLERVFEPFFTTKPEGQGTGLGLSMAYGFVKQSGGHIRIQSELGRGATVRIALPRTSTPEALDPEAGQDAPVGGSETILVVEDDHAVQAAAIDILRELGYRILQADNGEQALAIIRSGAAIDMLFTDVVMPGAVRSPELARQAKALMPGIAVLFASGYTQDAFAEGGAHDAGIHLLHKPYRREQLARTIRELLDARGKAQKAAAAAAAAATDSDAASVIRILVVEDNDDFRDLICELVRVLGYRADSARSAEDALPAIGAQHIDILLTDVNLPGLSGIELADRFRAASPRGRVIFSSGIDTGNMPSADARTLALRKPYGFEELKAAIAQVLAAPD